MKKKGVFNPDLLRESEKQRRDIDLTRDNEEPVIDAKPGGKPDYGHRGI
jgi:hypothetical protein